MTRVIEDRILKEANGNISDHLRHHIHLTNCIHLKNHMHRQSPVLADRSLMRDLNVLQKSRSLRDPSASPPSWQSPQIVDLLPKKGDRDTTVREGRSSLGIEPGRKGRKFSGSSPQLGINATSKVAPSEVGSKGETLDSRRIQREESAHRSDGNRFVGACVESLPDQCVSHMGHEVVSGNSEPKGKRSKQKGKHVQEVQTKTLSEQLKEVPMDSDGVSSCNVGRRGRHSRQEKIIDEPETSIRSHCNGSNRTKRRKFRGARRNRVSSTSRDMGTQNELSVDSNSLAPGTSCRKCYMEEEKEGYSKQNVNRGPGNGCGIPWNWSRIHDRGKNFLDLAGRSFVCGSSDTRLRKDGPIPHVRETYDIPIPSDQSNSHGKFDGDALPLLVEASGSHESCDNNGWVRDYSGELGIFADNLFEHDVEFDVNSEVRSGNQRKLSRHHIRHQSLTQKYMPKTFRDLVGQNLVAQALSNAVSKRKVGLLYVFYGPHGTGKTSCARIFARALNCQSLEPPKPCGFCNSCIAYDVGKSGAIREVGPVSDVDLESITELLDNMNVSHLPWQYGVFIFDDCDSLPANCWSSISKVIDQAPRRIVIVLVSSSLDVLPHIIISRCQKFFFPKLKDADIIYTLQWIATKEDLDIDKDALKLIASRSDGSLRDAEMTLEQLSLLGQRISVPLVQELVGLISDEKLIDLLDLALSADTVNTVKNLRTIMETGVEPLALMSQLATVITDVLAGSYDLTKERPRRKFFRRQPLSKDDMEKLRQALRILSEAEKQLRMSSDKLTWLTAALLQLAPDQQYMLSSSSEASFNQSPLALNDVNGLDLRRSSEKAEMTGKSRNGSHSRQSNLCENGMKKNVSLDRRRQVAGVLVPQQTSTLSSENTRIAAKQIYSKSHHEIEEIWLDVLQQIQISRTKEFLSQEGKLISVTFGAAPTVQLMFSSHLAKSMAERCRGQILRAFEAVLRSPVTIEIRCESKDPAPLILSASKNSLSHGKLTNNITPQSQFLHPDREIGNSEIFEVAASPAEKNSYNRAHNHAGEAAGSSKKSNAPSIQERNKFGNLSHSQSIVRGKVSLAHVIQQAEGYSQRSRWSKRKAISIAEKLEQENLRLEPQSRSLLCWKACRATRRKLSRLKIRKQKRQPLLKFICCGKCLSVNSPSFELEISCS